MSKAWLVWLFAWAIVIAFMVLLCMIQERPYGQTIRQALGWGTGFCLVIIALGTLCLFAFGLI